MNPNNPNEVGQWIQSLLDKNNLHLFYTSRFWLNVREEVLIDHKYECQHCKARGFYKKADTVHHEQYVRKHPPLALSKTYEYNGNVYRQLTPLCDECHKKEHNKHKRKKGKPLTEERW